MVGPVVGFGAIFMIVGVGICVWSTFLMRAGRNRARIALTIISGLWLLAGLAGLAQAGRSLSTGIMTVPMLVLGIVDVLIIIVTLVVMYRPAAQEYFRRPTWPPR
jgi:hypothetical protein